MRPNAQSTPKSHQHNLLVPNGAPSLRAKSQTTKYQQYPKCPCFKSCQQLTPPKHKAGQRSWLAFKRECGSLSDPLADILGTSYREGCLLPSWEETDEDRSKMSINTSEPFHLRQSPRNHFIDGNHLRTISFTAITSEPFLIHANPVKNHRRPFC